MDYKSLTIRNVKTISDNIYMILYDCWCFLFTSCGTYFLNCIPVHKETCEYFEAPYIIG